jgi:hypothetical protein
VAKFSSVTRQILKPCTQTVRTGSSQASRQA